jgi:hypothetical protein
MRAGKGMRTRTKTSRPHHRLFVYIFITGITNHPQRPVSHCNGQTMAVWLTFFIPAGPYTHTLIVSRPINNVRQIYRLFFHVIEI